MLEMKSPLSQLMASFEGRTDFDDLELRKLCIAAGVTFPSALLHDSTAGDRKVYSRDTVARFLQQQTQRRII